MKFTPIIDTDEMSVEEKIAALGGKTHPPPEKPYINGDGGTAPTGNFPLLTEDDLENLPDPTWLIDDILVADTLCVLYGPWGSYKSFIALHLALCLASGMAFFGRAVVRSDVLYIAGEGAGGIKKRVAAWKNHHKIKRIPGFRVVPVAVNLLEKAEAKRLVRTVLDAQKADGFNPKLVIVDTLHRAMPGGDENTAKEMGIVITNGAIIQHDLGGCTLMPVHHSGKDFEKGMRGSTGLPGASDTILRQTRDGTSNRCMLLVEKQKDGEDGQEHHIISKVIDLPPSANGKLRNSLVLIENTDPPTKEGSRLIGGEGKAKQFLADLIVSEGKPLPQGSGYPSPFRDQPVKGVTEERWQDECDERRLSTAQERKFRNLAFRRIFKKLLDGGEVGARGGFVWLAK